MPETTYLTILATLAIGLLIAVTAGVAYLTTMEWRDRRRLDREKRDR
jgi:hypothetical protein